MSQTTAPEPPGGRRGRWRPSSAASAGQPSLTARQLTAAGLALALLGGALLLSFHPWTSHVAALTVQVTQSGGPAGLALDAEPALQAQHRAPAHGTEVIGVDSAVHRQTVQGFGSAMTDSSAWLLETQLAPVERLRVMRALFSPSGIRLTNLRIPVGASDFTATGIPYSYDDRPPQTRDPRLRHFTVHHDDRYILPALKLALRLNAKLGFIATPWSLPAWMKTNDRLSNLGDTGGLKREDFTVEAQYMIDFLLEYEAAGVDVKEITPANEPTTATHYPGMNISAAAENTLISRYLVPALRRRGLGIQIYGADLGWQNARYARTLATGAAARDLTGIAWHCYYGSPTVMSQVQALDRRLGVQMTECSPGISTVAESEVIIESLRNGASVVDLWNLALDDRGGPVEPPNHGCPGCYGLVRVDTATHSVSYTEAYDDLGQAAKFIEPGAVRVESSTFVRYDYTGPGANYVSRNVDDVAVRNPDGEMILMAYNNATTSKSFTVEWHGYSFGYRLPAGATVTLRWR